MLSAIRSHTVIPPSETSYGQLMHFVTSLSFWDLIASENFVSEGNPNTTPVVVGSSEDRRRRGSGGRKKTPAAKKLAREHGELVKAAHRLEDAFASPCPGHEQDWREGVTGALTAAIETLKSHARSAAYDGGPIAET